MADLERVVVCGYYGFGNAGDEAILAALLADLRSSHPGIGITVLSGTPNLTAGEYDVDAVAWQDIPAIVTAARSADLMILGGGGLFQDHHEFDAGEILTARHGSIGYYGGFALLARMVDTPLAIYGVGVGPLRTEAGRRYTRIAFQQAGAATVRDDSSLQLLEEIGADTSGVTVTADPAWMLQAASHDVVPSILELESAPAGDTTIGVTVRPWGDGSHIGPLAEALDRLADELEARVMFVPFQTSPLPHENDPHAALEVLRQMKRIDRAFVVRGGYSVPERMALLASCRLVVGMRLHSVIFAARVGAPVVALSYDPKVTSVMEDLDTPDQVVDLEGLTAEAVVETAHTALKNGPCVAFGLREAAERNIEVFERFGRGDGPVDDTFVALRDLALARVEEAAERNVGLGQVRLDLRQVEAEHRRLAAYHEALQRQKDELVQSRAMRLVSSYWAAREGIREGSRNLATAVGRKAPKELKPVLKRIAGVETPRIEAPEVPRDADPEEVRKLSAEIRSIVERYPGNAGVVVYPPSIGWNVSLFQRPQQMALAFAKLGYVVFYGVDDREGIDRITEAAPRVHLAPVSWAMMEALGSIAEPITVSYVYNFAWTKGLDRPRVIFEHIDELEVFTATHGIEDLRGWYEEAIEQADIVVASARDLLARVEKRRPDAFLCPNGVDYRHFAGYRAGEPPEDIRDLILEGLPIIGYYGAIAEWVDYGLIRKSATELSEFNFVFIGPEYDASVKQHLEVFDLPNVRWLGVKDYNDLPAYLHFFDVATIPFVVSEVTHSVSPLKLFEYFAGGRPVVTPPLRECAEYEAVLIAEDPDDYIAKLKKAVELRYDEDHQALLKRTARANTWEMRVGTLLDALARTGR